MDATKSETMLLNLRVRNQIIWLIHDAKPTKCTNLSLIYWYYNITLNTPKCFGLPGTVITVLNQVIHYKTKSVTLAYIWRGVKQPNASNVDTSLRSCCITWRILTYSILQQPTYLTKVRTVQRNGTHTSQLHSKMTAQSASRPTTKPTTFNHTHTQETS